MQRDDLTVNADPGRDRLALDLAILAGKAGQIALAIFHEDRTSTSKLDGSPVTRADVETQAFIVQGLQDLLPGVHILAEEAGFSEVELPCDQYLLVDPLDGTKEFIRGTTEWTINIGLVRCGEVVAGAVALPASDTVYWGGARAFRGQTIAGAIIDQVPIQTRAPAENDLVAICSRDHSGPEVEELLQVLQIKQTISAGSSLKMLRIAEGCADIYPRLGPTMGWDTAAAHSVLRAAGGGLFRLDGTPLTYASSRNRNPSFVAFGVSKLPNRIVDALATFDPRAC